MLNNLKKRFKRALAGFLKDELNEYTDYSSLAFGPMNQQVIIDEVGFETYKMEKIINVDRQYCQQCGFSSSENFDPISFQIDAAKREFAGEIVEHIHVDVKELTDPVYKGKASIRLILRVQTPR